MKVNDRIRAYSSQMGIESKGSFKNSTSTTKLISKLTPKQKKRIKKK